MALDAGHPPTQSPEPLRHGAVLGLGTGLRSPVSSMVVASTGALSTTGTTPSGQGTASVETVPRSPASPVADPGVARVRRHAPRLVCA